MDRVTILRTKKCDLTRLSLTSREASVFARIDGRLTLEEVAELASLDFASTARLARQLLELGAVEMLETEPPKTKAKPAKKPIIVEEDARVVRSDPRADPRVERSSIRPERRATRKSLRKASASMPPPSTRRTTTPPSSKRLSAPPSKRPTAPPKKASTPPRRVSSPPKKPSSPPARKSKLLTVPKQVAITEKPRTNRSERSLRALTRAAREITVQARLDLLLKAAEESVMCGDFIAAANNYRLALEHREDPQIRAKLDEVEPQAKTLRFTRSITQARIAEREERWADVATHLELAYNTRPTAELADRTARAILRSEGNLERASQLAQRAVSLDTNNVDYRLTFAEVLLAQNKSARAEEEVSAALDLAPGDARARGLLAQIAKRRKK